MSIGVWLEELQARDVRIWLEDGRLMFDAPAGELTPEEQQQLRSGKSRIIEYLERAPGAGDGEQTVFAAERFEAKQLPSYAQERLWFIDRLDPGATQSNIGDAILVKGALSISAFRNAVNAVIKRHESLRTVFCFRDRVPVCRILDELNLDIEVIELALRDGTDTLAAAQQRATEDHLFRFNLEQGPLLRITLFRSGEGLHVAALTLHHIIGDAGSLEVFWREVGEFYTAETTGRSPAVPVLPVQFGDFARWERTHTERTDVSASRDYWKRRLAGVQALQLPLQQPRPSVPQFRGAKASGILSASSRTALHSLAVKHSATTFICLVTVFAALLRRYSGQVDLTIGTPVGTRRLPELQGLIGPLINNLVIRFDMSGNPSFDDLLRKAGADIYADYEHQNYPFQQLVDELEQSRDISRSPLFQVAFSYQSVNSDMLTQGSLTGERLEREVSQIRYDLELHVSDRGNDGLHVALLYDTELFTRAFVEQLLGHYLRLIERIIEDPARPVFSVPLLSQEEQKQLLECWNDTARAHPGRSTVQSVLEETVRSHAAAVAVSSGADSITYEELAQRAKYLSALLVDSGIGPGDLVAVCCTRCIDMVIGLVGIFNAGAAYVPIDLDYPDERLNFMLEDCSAGVLLTDSRHADRFDSFTGTVLVLDALNESNNRVEGLPEAAVHQGSPDDLAYVIYTSGSTGQPKGVEVTHANLLNLVYWHREVYELTPHDRCSQIAGLAFDATAWEIWPCLTAGARLVLIGEDVRRDPGKLWHWMTQQAITVSFLPTPLAEAALRFPVPGDMALRYLLTGGDVLHSGLARQLPFRLVNHYGPTENTVVSTSTVIDPGDERLPSIGKPIHNVRVYVLDEQMCLVPSGVEGELYVGGASVARGYWRRPELTASRFLDDPFDAAAGARMYRTGDIVRFREDGSLDFVGRADGQLKIRGFRVEIGEIEQTLQGHPGIEQAVVVPVTTSMHVELGAYLVAAPAAEPGALDSGALRSWLQTRLPSYMIPSAYAVLDGIPTTENGKVDRAALPGFELPAARPGTGAAPRQGVESLITEIWADVLQLTEIDPRANFFDLGGHSLRLLEVHSRLTEALGPCVSVLDLFQHTTIEAVARLIGADEEHHSADLHQQTSSLRPGTPGTDPIAVIGMSGRFPGAADVAALWENLRDGVESIRFHTPAELREAGVDESLFERPDFVPASARIEGADLFDGSFFGYTPRECELIDPQQRVLLECAWQALEVAGYDPEQYPGLIGVWAGVDPGRYIDHVRSHPSIVEDAGEHQLVLSSDKDYLCTRISYKLGLRGPSVNVQSACSTSLVAVHEACQGLLAGDCDMALTGGVALGSFGPPGYIYQPGGIRSPDGHCRTFDARAGGTIPAAGAGLVVLKRLEDAVRDGDSVDAVILGTAINNDGHRKVGFTAPSVDGQAEVIAKAHAAAGVDASAISYIEAHGTGTQLGDPIEIAALQQVFSASSRRQGPCAIGSLKSNIGHLNSAAGVGGLIKTILALKHRQLPPSLHFESPNPEARLDGSLFYVNTELQAWDAVNDERLTAGVSSFGLGGTNAHAVIQEAPQREPAQSRLDGRESDAQQLLVVSARSETALRQRAADLLAHLRKHPEVSIPDVACTLQVGRQAMSHRSSMAVSSGEVGERYFERLAAGEIQPVRASESMLDVVFMFPGQGSQFVNMGAGLYAIHEVFRSTFDQCCELLRSQADVDLRTVLFPQSGITAEATARLTATSMAQPALFTIEYSLAVQLMHWGLRPAACIGHSIGEYVAACIGGVFSLEDALRIVSLRGKLMEGMPAGCMTAVPLSEADLTVALEGHSDLWLSTVNAPQLCVVSGGEAAVRGFERDLKDRGVGFRRLRTSHAFHSGMMEDAVEPFVDALSKLDLNETSIAFPSNVTGQWITADEVTNPAHWGRQLREPVRFSQCLATLGADIQGGLIEVGPGEALKSLCRMQTDAAQARAIVSTVGRQDDNECAQLLDAVGELWCHGARVHWERLDEAGAGRRVALPAYPFQRQRYWLELLDKVPAVVRRNPLDKWFYVPSWASGIAPVVDAEDEASARHDKWLVVGANHAFGGRLLERLQPPSAGTGLAGFGTSYAEDGLNYVLAADSREDFDKLFASLTDKGAFPDRIVFLNACSASPAVDVGVPSADIASGFNTLLFLLQALDSAGDGKALRLDVVSSGIFQLGRGEVLHPQKSVIVGPCKAIPKEYPHIQCRLIDLSVQELQDNPEQAAGWVAGELLVPSGDQFVAYRNGRRFTEAFAPVELAAVPAGKPRRLRDRGVYLVTGGLGGMGLVIAGYLARTVQANLVLVSRSGLPPRSEWENLLITGEGDAGIQARIRQVTEIEAAGARVLVKAADVTDLEAMSAVVREIVQEFGEINGIVHAAGTSGEGILALKDPATVRTVLAPKVAGATVLQQLFETSKLDFFVLCSSLAALVPAGGQADYAAANAWLDAFAYQFGQQSGCFTVAVNWNRWTEAGMAVEYARSTGRRVPIADGCSNQEGIEVFERILHRCTVSQIAISETELAARISEASSLPGERPASDPVDSGQRADDSSTSGHARPDLDSGFAPAQTATQIAVVAIWERLLGMDGIGIDDDFYKLGGHSLLVLQVVTRLTEQLGVHLSMRSAMQFATVRSLSEELNRLLATDAGEEGTTPDSSSQIEEGTI
jgi:amino acid adenylation domain-containing protein